MRVSSNKRRRPAAFCTGGAAGSEGRAPSGACRKVTRCWPGLAAPRRRF